MSADRDVTQSVRSWLDEGVTTLPDRVLDAVLDQLPATPQRRATWWPVRRLPVMNKTLIIGVAAAAVVMVAFLGIRLLGPSGFGNPGETPVVTPTPEPVTLRAGAEGPGTFSTVPTGDNPVQNPPDITFEMPADWMAAQRFLISTESAAGSETLLFVQPSGLHSDPCLQNSGDPDVTVGSTADAFASALVAHTAYDATVTGAAVIDGYDAIRMELATPSDLDYSICEGGQFWVWDAPFYAEAPSQWDLWIVDLDGSTVVLLAEGDPTAEQRDQLEGIVQSMQINP